MSFFNNLHNLMNEDVDVNLKFCKSEKGFVVKISPQSNNQNAKTPIPSISVNGSLEDLETGFFETIKSRLQKSNGLITNLDWHDKMIDTIKSDKEKELKDKSKGNKGKKQTSRTGTSNQSGTSKNEVQSSTEKKEETESTVSTPTSKSDKSLGGLFAS